MGPAEIIHGHKDRHYFAGGRKRACLRGAQRQDTRRSLVVAWQRGAGGEGLARRQRGRARFSKEKPTLLQRRLHEDCLDSYLSIPAFLLIATLTARPGPASALGRGRWAGGRLGPSPHKTTFSMSLVLATCSYSFIFCRRVNTIPSGAYPYS